MFDPRQLFVRLVWQRHCNTVSKRVLHVHSACIVNFVTKTIAKLELDFTTPPALDKVDWERKTPQPGRHVFKIGSYACFTLVSDRPIIGKECMVKLI